MSPNPVRPSSIVLPRLRTGAGAPDGEVEYALADFPLPPSRLRVSTTDRSRVEGLLWLEWIHTAEHSRLQYAMQFFAEAGAPVDGLPGDLSPLADLTGWLQVWFPVAYAPWRDVVWRIDPARHAVRWMVPGHDVDAETVWLPWTLQASLAHDLAFIVVAAATHARPELAWQLDETPYTSKTGPRRHSPAIHPGREPLAQPLHAADLVLTGSLARQGQQPTRTRDYYTLDNAYTALVTEAPVPAPAREQGAPALTSPAPSPLTALPHRPAGAPTIPDTSLSQVANTVHHFRAGGWFGSAELRALSDHELAAHLNHQWYDRQQEPLPPHQPGLSHTVAELDPTRALRDDIEADVAAGNGVYQALLRDLQAIAGDTFTAADIVEHWDDDDNNINVTCTLNGHPASLALRNLGDIIDPAVVTGLNQLLPPGGPRFWFVDTGGQSYLIVRATTAERHHLHTNTELRLDDQPPGWWTPPIAQPQRPN